MFSNLRILNILNYDFQYILVRHYFVSIRKGTQCTNTLNYDTETQFKLKTQITASLREKRIFNTLNVKCFLRFFGRRGWECIDQGYLWGTYPSRGDFHLARRREKFLSTFFEIWKCFRTFFEFFGKFVNKNAIKRDFWGFVGRYISKISKKSPFLGKNTSTNFQNFLDTSTKVPTTPPQIPLSWTI